MNPIPIIVVTFEDNRIDCKVQGSPLSVRQYGDAVSLVIRNIASLFARNSNLTEDAVVQAIVEVVDERARVPIDSNTEGPLLQ